MTDDSEQPINPALTFTEAAPGTYVADFTDFSDAPRVNAVQAHAYLEHIKKAAAAHPNQKINIINDTTIIGSRVASLSPEARNLYLDAYRHPAIGKVAMVGFGPWLKTFISILAQFAGRSAQTAFFDTRPEALAWIQETGAPSRSE